MNLKETKFEWDQWNVQKNEIKHNVTWNEAESCFEDPNHGVYDDPKHSTSQEKRFGLFGKGNQNRILMVGFTLRKNKVRVITARPASKKERDAYEKEIKRNS